LERNAPQTLFQVLQGHSDRNSGSALAKTGPAGIFIDFSIIGLAVFCVMAALGEMLSFAPMARM